jgi:hypothetical protein
MANVVPGGLRALRERIRGERSSVFRRAAAAPQLRRGSRRS